ncbi:MAG TPA: hypothetical protein PK280_07875 [Planctomycetota bacterium]|nr:hypothetical protein [Planctomycetota bacterium]
MSNDEREFREVEDLLRRMPLAEPPERLDRRVLSMAGAGRFRRARAFALAAISAAAAAAAGAAVTLAIMNSSGRRAPTVPLPNPVVRRSEAATPQADLAVFKGPVRVERQRVGRTSAEGMIDVSGEDAVQRYRREGVREIWLVDPDNNRRVDMAIPVKDTVLVKVEPY